MMAGTFALSKACRAGDAFQPGGDGLGFEEKGVGRLFEIPGSGRLEFEDSQPFGGRIVRAVCRRHPGHAGVFDPDFLLEKSDLAPDLFEFGGAAHTL